ncbi:MAG: DNA repair exonuclease [Verrucomicrobia bacterium]|nr:DNA repair exonuclease [Verrucomicrobiota bacterium]
MAVRILHFADCHLGYHPAWLGELAERRAEDFRRTFARIVDMALEPANAVDLVAIPGDVFEHHAPSERAVGFVRDQLRRLAERPIPVVLVPGNHDGIGYTDSVYRREKFPGVTLVTSPQVDKVVQLSVRGETVHIYSAALDLSRGVDTLATFQHTDEPGLHVAMLHAAVWANPTWELKDDELPLRPEQIAASGMHYIMLGHYHQYAEHREGGVLAVYSGSTEGKDFGECGPRYAVIAEVDEGGVQIEKRECHTRELREVALDLSEQPAASDAEIAERLLERRGDTLLLRVRLTGPADFVPNIERIADRLQSAFFHVEVVDETRLVDGELVRRLSDESTIRGLFVRKMIERARSASGDERATAELGLKFGLDEFLREEED